MALVLLLMYILRLGLLQRSRRKYHTVGYPLRLMVVNVCQLPLYAGIVFPLKWAKALVSPVLDFETSTNNFPSEEVPFIFTKLPPILSIPISYGSE